MSAFIDAAARFIIAVLFNGLWEAALLAAAAWVALRAMPNGNATTRHSVLAAALFASLILPVVTAFVTTADVLPARSVPAAPSVSPATAQHRAAAAAPVRAGHTIVPNQTAVPALPAAAAAPRLRPSLTLPRAVMLALVAAWMLGALFVLLRLTISLLHLERLKRDALPVAVEYRAGLARWTAASKGSRTVRLCRSSEIVIPIAVGLFDAMILVPDRLLEELSPDDIDRIVLHELAHLRRADDWINALERVAQALLFFNPGISWLVAQLDLEREVACDDWVLQQNEPLPYATCLAKVVETTVWPYRAMSAPGAFVTRRGMSVRIERLLCAHRDVRVRTSLGPAGLVVTALAALSIVAAFVSPSIAYTASAAEPAIAAKTNAPVISARVAPRGAAPIASASARIPVAVTVSSAVRNATAVAVNAAVRTATRTATTTALRESQAASASASAASRSAGVATPLEVAANSPDYIDELASVGYTNLSIDDLIRLRSLGVTADFIRRMNAAGLGHPSVSELLKLRALGVEPDFIKSMRDRFGSSVTIDEIAGMRAVGVTGAYIRELSNAGYPNLSVDAIQRMRALGIDGAFISRAASHGFHNLPVDQLIRLKVSSIIQ